MIVRRLKKAAAVSKAHRGPFSASSRARIVAFFRKARRRHTHRVVREVRVAVIAVVARHFRKMSLLPSPPSSENRKRRGRSKQKGKQ